MKFVNKKHGRIYATGRLEISKIRDFKWEREAEEEITFTFKYDTANMRVTSGKGGFLEAYCFAACYIGKDNLLSFEAHVERDEEEIETLILLEAYEKELLLGYIANYLVQAA